MEKNYVVFWMPSLFHGTMNRKKSKIENTEHIEGYYDLSDESDYPYLAKFSLLDDGSIIVHSKVYQTKHDFVVFDTLLTMDQKRKNGFMQFSFIEEDGEYGVPANCRVPFKGNLTTTIYHRIKEFYHTHECNTGKDSDLIPDITDHQINLEGDNNPALIKFLLNFSDLFRKSVELVSQLNAKAENVFEEYAKFRSHLNYKLAKGDDSKWEAETNNFLSITLLINKMLENASIEYTYCKTLLSSIYNKSFKHDVALAITDINYDDKNLYRREALNIRNSIRYIENIKYKSLNRELAVLHISSDIINFTANKIDDTTVGVDQSMKKGDIWQKIGFTLAIYSILSSILFSVRSEMCNVYFWVILSTISVISLLYIFISIYKLRNTVIL